MDEREREIRWKAERFPGVGYGVSEVRHLLSLLDKERRECAETHVRGADVKDLRGRNARLVRGLKTALNPGSKNSDRSMARIILESETPEEDDPALD